MYTKAEHDDHWCATMCDKPASIEENKTWTLTDTCASHKPVGLTRVFKLKRDDDGEVLKHKDRMVAKWYVH